MSISFLPIFLMSVIVQTLVYRSCRVTVKPPRPDAILLVILTNPDMIAFPKVLCPWQILPTSHLTTGLLQAQFPVYHLQQVLPRLSASAFSVT